MKEKTKFTSIAEMQTEKSDWVTQTKALNNFEGIRNTLTNIYTSSGHFVYELIQNAEDVDATEIIFKLEKNKLIFRHNGTRLFNLDDIDSITNIGDSTKKDNGTTIGKFGIGFKSVFEYTETPEIKSGKYHFKIEELFIPVSISDNENFEDTTIELPFNGFKGPVKCYDEIKDSLSNLKSDTLLFLRKINSIKCYYENTEIILNRIDNISDEKCPNKTCRLYKSKSENLISEPEIITSHYRRNFKEIEITDENGNKKTITIGVAFRISKEKELNTWNIKPIYKKGTKIPNGKIYAYFPCKKEEKRFCFHMHAPFALTVDREKLRENDTANNEVIKALGMLINETILEFKKDKLIGLPLYNALPNTKDDIDLGQFEPIQNAVIDCFKQNELVLMNNGTYNDANNKFIGYSNIQELLKDNLLAEMYNEKFPDQQYYWVKTPLKNSRDYNFYLSIGIKEFTVVDFLKTLIDIKKGKNDLYNRLIITIENNKSTWFIKLYSLMKERPSAFSTMIQDIRALDLCYCEEKKVYPFKDCFLPDKISKIPDYKIHYINSEIIDTETKDTYVEVKKIKDFLEDTLKIPVYTMSNFIEQLCIEFEREDSEKKDGKKFILELYKLYKNERNIIEVIKKRKILKTDEGFWVTPEKCYLPEEYNDNIKNISIFYDFYNLKQSSSYTKIFKLSPDYISLFENKKDLSDFIFFLKNIGIYYSLPLKLSSCENNSNWSQINREAEKSAGGNRYITDEDWKIDCLNDFLRRKPNEAVFELIWSFLINCDAKDYSKCKYKTATKLKLKVYDSELVNCLLKNEWVLQKRDNEITFTTPENAVKKYLPAEYQKNIDDYDYLSNWCTILHLGRNDQLNSEQQKKEDAVFESVGLDLELVRMLQDLQKFDVNPQALKEFMENMKNDLNSRITDENFFINENADVDRIKNKARENFNNAGDANFEKRDRNVRLGNTGVKAMAEAFLKERYSDDYNRVHCQICKKTMPFKRPDGQDYFEVIQLFNTKLILKEVKENYILTCPVCSAKYQVYFHNKEKQAELYRKIKHSQEHIQSFSVEMDGEEIIDFENTHIIALRTMIQENE